MKVAKERTTLWWRCWAKGKIFWRRACFTPSWQPPVAGKKYAVGVYTSGVVFEPRFYESFADMMQEGELPILNWVWFGLYRSEGGLNAYTYGMDVFGKDEMEVLNADAEPDNLEELPGKPYWLCTGKQYRAPRWEDHRLYGRG